MALIKCLECNKYVFDVFESCSNCGKPINRLNSKVINNTESDANLLCRVGWKEIRCPKCKHINPIVKVCQKCNFEILDTLNNKLKWFKRFNCIREVMFFPSMIMLTLVVFLMFGMFIDKVSSSLFEFVFMSFLLIVATWFSCYCFCRDLGPDIREYNPDQSININIFSFLARIFAFGIGAEILHTSFDSIGNGFDSVTDGVDCFDNVDTTATMTPVLDPSGMFDKNILFDSNTLDETAGGLLLPLHSHLADNINELKLHTPDTTHFIVTDHIGMTEAHVDVQGHIVTFSNNLGLPMDHIDNHSGVVTDNLNLPSGYIEHSLGGDSFVKNIYGVTEYHIDGNGSIFNAHGGRIGNIEKIGESIVLKDVLGKTLHTTSVS